jgi:hypothetical protein
MAERDRLVVRNWSGKTVVILDALGRPYLRFTSRGVFRGHKSVAAGTH